MKEILIVGAGKIGQVAAELLAHSGDYQVTLADRSLAALSGVARCRGLNPTALDVADGAALRQALRGRFAVLSAAPYHLTVEVAQAARDSGAHYLDLTEDVASTRRIRELAQGANTAF